MPRLYRLSPSDLTFLWDECKRCFYLKVVHGFPRPQAPFPKIFARIDKLMNSFYMGRSTRDIAPDLPPGHIQYGEQWVTSQAIRPLKDGPGCVLRGRFDTVIAFEGGGYGVVDFKTTEPSREHIAFYSRQLHAYAYALEHPAPGKLALKPVTHLGLICVEPSDIREDPGGRIAYVGEVTWIEMPKDEPGFLAFLREVLEILTQLEPPPPAPTCEYCAYRRRSRLGTW